MNTAVIRQKTFKRLGKIARNPLAALNMFNSLLIRSTKAKIDLAQERARSLDLISDVLSIDAHRLYRELLTSEFVQWYNAKKQDLIRHIGSNDSSGNFDCETLYLLIRGLIVNK